MHQNNYKIKDYSLKIYNKINELNINNKILLSNNIHSLYKFLFKLNKKSPHPINWNINNYSILEKFIDKVLFLRLTKISTHINILKIIELFLSKGCTLNNAGINPLFILLTTKFPSFFTYKLLRIVVKYNFNINYSISFFGNMLNYLPDRSDYFNLKTIKFLLHKGIKKGEGISNPLYFYKNYKILKLFLDNNYDSNISNYQENTVMHYLFNDYINNFSFMIPRRLDLHKILKLFIDYGFDVNKNNIFDQSILHTWIEDNSQQLHPQFCRCVELLINKGFNLNKTDFKGNNLLFYINFNIYKKSNYLYILKFLIKKGLDINHKNLLGETIAFNTDIDYEILEEMIKLGLDVNITNNTGKNILSHYLYHYSHSSKNFLGYTKKIEILLKNNINLNQLDNYGNTPIFYTVINDFIITSEFFYQLYFAGSNINHRNNFGNTPFDYLDIVDYFELIILGLCNDNNLLFDITNNLSSEKLNKIKQNNLEIFEGGKDINDELDDFIFFRKKNLSYFLKKSLRRDLVDNIILNYIFPKG